MKWLFAVVTVAALLVYGAWSYVFRAEVQPAPTEQAVMLPASTATPQPTPTLDYIATQKALIDAIAVSNAEADKLRDDLSASNANLNALSAQATADSNLAIAEKAKSDAIISTNNLEIEKEHTKQLEIIGTLTPQAAQNQAALLMATAEIVRVETERQEAENQANWRWFVLAGIFSLSGAGAYLGYGISTDAKARAAERAEPEPSHVTHITTPTAPGMGTTRRIPDPPGDPARVVEWAVAALAGESVAVDRWERQGSPLGGHREYRHGVYAWLIQHRLTMLAGKLILNADGEAIVSDYVARHPLPHSENEPNYTPSHP